MDTLDKAEVVMALGGTSYTFVWGTRAIREMQELLSTPEHLVTPTEIFFELKRGRVKFVCAFIWAGLLKHTPGVTHDDADDILDKSTDAEIKALLKRFGISLTPAPEDVQELAEGVQKNPRKARATRGTGAKSNSKRASPLA